MCWLSGRLGLRALERRDNGSRITPPPLGSGGGPIQVFSSENQKIAGGDHAHHFIEAGQALGDFEQGGAAKVDQRDSAMATATAGVKFRIPKTPVRPK